MRIKRLALYAASVALVASAAGCSSGYADTYVAPPLGGEAGMCYFVDSPAEAIAAAASGLCPVGWVPTPMPLAWHMRYSDYYRSSAYVTHYVPVASRNVYITHQTTFVSVHKKEIQRVRVTKVAAPAADVAKDRPTASKPSFRSGRSAAPKPTTPKTTTPKQSFRSGRH